MRISLFVLALLSPPAHASDIVVGPTDSIQAAIDLAVAGDRVLVDPGTYQEQINFNGKAIEVIGVQGALLTTIDADGVGTVVTFGNGEGPTTVLAGFTITGGAGTLAGGGIQCLNSTTPTIEDCVIRNNTGRAGAGVRGNPTLRRCTIRNNTSSQSDGGGVYGAPTLIDCIVSANTVTGGAGGGIFITGGSATIQGTIVEGNQAIFGQGRGAGIQVESSSAVFIERCQIYDNFGSAGVFGTYGGGIFTFYDTTQVVNCTIVNNNLHSGTATLGGGIYGPAQVRNSIVRGNTGTQLENASLVTYSNVEGGSPGVGNFDLDPLFADLVTFDLRLLPGSPCIDAGDPSDPLDLDGTFVDVGALPFEPSVLYDDLCSGDGGVSPGCTSCPCGNNAVPGTVGGCLNSAGQSARLLPSGIPQVSNDTLHFDLSGGVSASFAILISADMIAPTNPASPCFGLDSGIQSPVLDGLRCAVQGVLRHGTRSTDAAGDVGPTTPGWGPPNAPAAGLISANGFLAGQTRFFQAFYREGATLGCVTGQNTTQAVRVRFLP